MLCFRLRRKACLRRSHSWVAVRLLLKCMASSATKSSWTSSQFPVLHLLLVSASRCLLTWTSVRLRLRGSASRHLLAKTTKPPVVGLLRRLFRTRVRSCLVHQLAGVSHRSHHRVHRLRLLLRCLAWRAPGLPVPSRPRWIFSVQSLRLMLSLLCRARSRALKRRNRGASG